MVGARRNMGTTLAAISLARALAKQGRAVLVDLALEAPNLSVIASDVNAPGLSELVQGSVSFGQIITRDRYSRVHLITVGNGDVSSDAILSSQRLAITLEALSRSYDYVVLDAGALPEIAPEKFAQACAARSSGRRRHRRPGDRIRARTALVGRLPQCQRAGQLARRAGISGNRAAA